LIVYKVRSPFLLYSPVKVCNPFLGSKSRDSSISISREFKHSVETLQGSININRSRSILCVINWSAEIPSICTLVNMKSILYALRVQVSHDGCSINARRNFLKKLRV
jgi:hypothetical protein